MKITVQDISKAFAGRDIFHNFSQDIESGVRLCVCGPNGTGKSTLLRILAGVEVPDAGRVLSPRGCRLGYVEQDFDEGQLHMPLLDYVQEALPDWQEFWASWEAAATAKDDGIDPPPKAQLARSASMCHKCIIQ